MLSREVIRCMITTMLFQKVQGFEAASNLTDAQISQVLLSKNDKF